MQHASARKNHSALHLVLELSYISRPSMRLQYIQRLPVNPRNLPAKTRTIFFRKMRDQRWYVLRALSQRWYVDGKNVQSIIQITSESLCAHVLCQITIRRRDQAHVDPQRLSPT